jgi:hypothetical protein
MEKGEGAVAYWRKAQSERVLEVGVSIAKTLMLR